VPSSVKSLPEAGRRGSRSAKGQIRGGWNFLETGLAANFFRRLTCLQHCGAAFRARLKGCRPQICYIDDIMAWGTNEMTINWNAPLVYIASFLADVR
jgi:hypothetical protein